jgi:3-deoxy-manno-octulosonate cytidylyltransferase (CMP-KDO synthetase)
MPTLIVIPARFDSTRFPGKPLCPLQGPDGAKSLIQRSWMAGQAAARAIGADVVVATDDQRVAQHVTHFGGDIVMTSSLARNGTERCAEVAQMRQGYDLIVNLQGDSPLTPPWFIADIAAALQGDASFDMATPVLRCTGDLLHALKADRATGHVGGTTAVFSQQGQALYFSKEVIPFTAADYADTDPTPAFVHVGLYAYRPHVLRAYQDWPIGPLEAHEGLEQLRFLEQGRRVLCVQVQAQGRQFWEVNNPGDVAIVEAMLAHNAALG